MIDAIGSSRALKSFPRITVNRAACVIVIALAACARIPPVADAGSIDARVARLLQTTPLVDGHNDLHIHYHACREGCPRGYDDYDISKSVGGHTDLPRWKQGGVGAQLLNSGWLDTEPGLEGTFKGFAFTRSMTDRYSDSTSMARTSSDIRRIHATGKLAIVLALEDPDRSGTDVATIKRLAAEGLRSNIVAYSEPSKLADGHAGPMKFGGLSPLGSQVVRWMQQNGILVDLSHASADTMRDVLDQSIAPVIFSHSSAAALCDVSRNVPDDVLRRLSKNGGIVMISFVPEFTSKAFSDWYDAGSVYATRILEEYKGDRAKTKPFMDAWEKANPAPVVSVADVANHVEHVRDVAGIDHVGIGSDFDGIDFTVTGLEDVSKFPNLFVELAHRGWSDADLRKLAGENFLHVLDAADAARNSATADPSAPF
ncbi:MAG: dipeptidase [Xanthomonadales bacterium]|nr:dipeptidase [Xanthomonadales bacterium]